MAHYAIITPLCRLLIIYAFINNTMPFSVISPLRYSLFTPLSERHIIADDATMAAATLMMTPAFFNIYQRHFHEMPYCRFVINIIGHMPPRIYRCRH